MNDYIAEKVMPGGRVKAVKFQAESDKAARIWTNQNLPGGGWIIKQVNIAVA